MARSGQARTRNEALYLEIRASLLRGDFSPGQPIRADELCATYGVSVSVFREVLTRLAEQRLVTAEANKGFRVTAISIEDIDDLCLVRVELETLTTRLAIQRGDVAWQSEVLAAHHRLAHTPRASLSEDPAANERWSIAHSEFHAVCARACGSPRLIVARQQFFDEAEVFRQYARLHGGASRNVEGEHAAICEAFITREEDEAVRLMRLHVEGTAKFTRDAWLQRERELAEAAN